MYFEFTEGIGLLFTWNNTRRCAWSNQFSLRIGEKEDHSLKNII